MSTTLNGITRVCSEEALPCSQTLGGLGHPSTGPGAEGTSCAAQLLLATCYTSGTFFFFSKGEHSHAEFS